METVSTPISNFNPREPIPGYVLRERIGEGGYGEVWKSDAPGGLSKAVKIVYGAANASKAERELKALNRIKQVQHPLLLSLERIEIVDGHLVIVTELADGSLSDRFYERIEGGNVGIERDELLGYMSDAADALDFLYMKHSLQHLDVKPENLLLLANRVKVADFGMVKDLHEKQETLVGGMTPLYAPPEIYDGKPNRHSDQYSLAVVFQHLICGQPPFSGRTAAQLASQHLHGTPDLTPLVESDRAPIARALSKDPQQRFSCCQELITALRESQSVDRPFRPRRQLATGGRERSTRRRMQQPRSTGHLTAGTIELPWPTSVVTLDPISDASPATDAMSCVFVGVGDMAARCLRHLRQRITAQFGPREAIPSIQFLLLDTDTQTLSQATQGDRDAAFALAETVATPLRNAEHYRSRSKVLLEWLERRWLYNIPRTQQTEGLRPLGRLAFVDHYPAVSSALKTTLERATDKELQAISEKAVRRPFVEGAVRVFIVGSTTGGTSSGMLLDLAYATRSKLQELNLSEDHLHGILLHATRNQGGSRDLQLGTSLAFLREFAHYCTAGSYYPGEPECGIPACDSNAAPFAHSYLLDLGDRLTPKEIDQQTAQTADYLFAASVSTAANVFQRAREKPFTQFGPGECQIRTFGTTHVSADEQRDRTSVDYLCRSVVQRWIGDDSKEQLSSAEIEALTAKFSHGLDLRCESLCERAERLADPGVVIANPTEFAQRVAEAAAACAADAPPELTQQTILEAIDDLWDGLGGGRELSTNGKTWPEQLSESLRSEVAPRVEALVDWFAMLAKQPKVRLRGVQHALSCILDHLSSLEVELRELSQQRMQAFQNSSGQRSSNSALQYATIRFQQHADRSVAGYVGTIRRRMQEYETRLHEFRRRLDELQIEFTPSDVVDEQDHVSPAVARRRRQLLVALENQLNENSLGLASLAEMTTKHWSDLAGTFRKLASQIVTDANKKQRVSQFISTVELRSPESEGEISQLLEQAKPRLHQCGGSERSIVIVPDSADFDSVLSSPSFHSTLKDATVVRTNEEGVSVCCEMSGVPLSNVVIKLSAGRKQCLELANRLLSRIDIDWNCANSE